MKVVNAKLEFIDFLSSNDLSTDRLRPNDGVDLMLKFYEAVRAEKCSPENDGDMLLYQWGTYDWGNGRHFVFNITRQLIEENGADADDDNMWQLSLTFKSSPNDQTAGLDSGNKWCHGLEDLSQFRHFILKSNAYRTAMKLPSKIELLFEKTG